MSKIRRRTLSRHLPGSICRTKYLSVLSQNRAAIGTQRQVIITRSICGDKRTYYLLQTVVATRSVPPAGLTTFRCYQSARANLISFHLTRQPAAAMTLYDIAHRIGGNCSGLRHCSFWPQNAAVFPMFDSQGIQYWFGGTQQSNVWLHPLCQTRDFSR